MVTPMALADALVAGLLKELQDHPENVIDVLRKILDLMEKYENIRLVVVKLLDKAADKL